MRRRRLDAFRNAPRFPGKERAQAAEQARYDHWLVVAAHMLELDVPEAFPGPGRPVAPEVRAVLEDRLAQAGLDVFAARNRRSYDVVGDDDAVF